MYDPVCVNAMRLNFEYEVELNISMVTSVCFQELTVNVGYDNDNCSCSVTQVTAELNHLRCLISENHYTRCLNVDYTIYVVTDDGTESNSLNVTCSTNTINSVDIMTPQTSNRSI